LSRFTTLIYAAGRHSTGGISFFTPYGHAAATLRHYCNINTLLAASARSALRKITTL